MSGNKEAQTEVEISLKLITGDILKRKFSSD